MTPYRLMSPPPHSPLADAESVCRLSAGELIRAFSDRTLSPVEVIRAVLVRAEQVRDRFGAFVLIDAEGALAAASESERRWREGRPLSVVDGVSCTVKDIVWVKGWPVRYGSSVVDKEPCSDDSPAVARLRAAGAVLIGLTTTPEFGWKAVTDNQLDGVTRNPWNPALTAGGSSGGAAVAAACGAGALHVGTDGGGSIRIPAAFCGIVGFKPTFGRVAAHPGSAFGTLAHIGPMARTVDDAHRMLTILSGRDLRDWAQGPGKLAPVTVADQSLEGMRVGYWRTPATGVADAEVTALADAAIDRIAAAGGRVTPINLPGENLLAVFQTLWFAGAAKRIAMLRSEQRARIDPGLAEIAGQGAALSALDYLSATAERAAFGVAMDKLLCEIDFLVSPAVAVPPFEAGRETPDGRGMARWTEWAGFNFPLNLSQQPACVIPCGFTTDGRPIGLQLAAARGEDSRLLSFSQHVQELLQHGIPGG